MRLWKACLKMIPESPILGYGPEQLNEKYSGELGGVLAGGTDRPENEYIQYMVFMGIPGLVMYMGALISMMICQLKKIKKMELITIASAGVHWHMQQVHALEIQCIIQHHISICF
jgi:O-antigen ligase